MTDYLNESVAFSSPAGSVKCCNPASKYPQFAPSALKLTVTSQERFVMRQKSIGVQRWSDEAGNRDQLLAERAFCPEATVSRLVFAQLLGLTQGRSFRI